MISFTHYVRNKPKTAPKGVFQVEVDRENGIWRYGWTLTNKAAGDTFRREFGRDIAHRRMEARPFIPVGRGYVEQDFSQDSGLTQFSRKDPETGLPVGEPIYHPDRVDRFFRDVILARVSRIMNPRSKNKATAVEVGVGYSRENPPF